MEMISKGDSVCRNLVERIGILNFRHAAGTKENIPQILRKQDIGAVRIGRSEYRDEVLVEAGDGQSLIGDTRIDLIIGVDRSIDSPARPFKDLSVYLGPESIGTIILFSADNRARECSLLIIITTADIILYLVLL